MAKTECILGSSRAVSWISGSCMNSSGKNSSVGLLAEAIGTAVMVGADAEFELPPDDRDRSGHSAFQCPFLPHSLQDVSIILCWRLFRAPLNCPLPFPLKVLPFPFEGFVGQNPRFLKRSLRRRRASVHALYAVASSVSSWTVSAIADSYSLTKHASSSPSWIRASIMSSSVMSSAARTGVSQSWSSGSSCVRLTAP